jgi:hypothetical protein
MGYLKRDGRVGHKTFPVTDDFRTPSLTSTFLALDLGGTNL